MGDWRNNLLKTMNDPNSIVYRDNSVVIIKDKYPKSEYHYLVLPYQDIPSLKSCSYQHKPIIDYMESKAREFARSHHTGKEFWLGFHAQPSLNRLHLHLISSDFRGQGLKTAKHYNSYTTKFFLPPSVVINSIARTGQVQTPSEEECQRLLKTPLKCHICGRMATNMPTLKLHLYSHITEV